MRLASSGTLWSSALLLSPAAFAFNVHPSLRPRQSADAPTFDWTTITPTPDLQYHSCYGGTFKCARLQVPLDWSKANGTSNNEGPFAAIAIVTLPAMVPSTSPAYAGPILINPGGPGGSGTEMALTLGSTIQALADVPGERHYDIVGFDPRGVAFTTPSSACYTSEFARAVDALQTEGMPAVVTEQGLKVRFETAKGMSKLCAQTLGLGDESVLRHVSTASVARDMLEIVERSHELLMKAGNGTVAGKKCGEEKSRLQYLGFSYGSILGSTFASMFPGRVGRMVVDGIADAEDYTKGTWQKNINDAEAAIDIFYRTCFNAGVRCALRSRTDRSAADIRARINALLHSLQQNPVSTVHNGRVYIVSSFHISEVIRTSLYTPINEYQNLSLALAQALTGNFSRILSNAVVMPKDLPSDVCSNNPVTSPPQFPNNHIDDAAKAIICGDSQVSAGRRDYAWAQQTVARLVNQSSTVGEAWTKVPLACAEWSFKPTYAFSGPFGSPAPDRSSKQHDKTPLAPLLILSTRTDHATPLANAFALSKLHGASAVVVQESVGHCALLSSPSMCTIGYVREYFATGKVPKNGTICQPDCVPEIPFKACPGLPVV
ncbi:hypothetical protein VTI74DRAFT_1074 [Chaetomium olivicolor]